MIPNAAELIFVGFSFPVWNMVFKLGIDWLQILVTKINFGQLKKYWEDA
jgi:hypothetical protein